MSQSRFRHSRSFPLWSMCLSMRHALGKFPQRVKVAGSWLNLLYDCSFSPTSTSLQTVTSPAWLTCAKHCGRWCLVTTEPCSGMRNMTKRKRRMLTQVPNSYLIVPPYCATTEPRALFTLPNVWILPKVRFIFKSICTNMAAWILTETNMELMDSLQLTFYRRN